MGFTQMKSGIFKYFQRGNLVFLESLLKIPSENIVLLVIRNSIP